MATLIFLFCMSIVQIFSRCWIFSKEDLNRVTTKLL